MKRKIQIALSMPPQVVAQKVSMLLARNLFSSWSKYRELIKPTYSRPVFPDSGDLHTFNIALSTESLHPHARILQTSTRLFLEHRFDLLGSGWARVHHNMSCPGVEGHRYLPARQLNPGPDGAWLNTEINRANRRYARKVWRLVDPDYIPIDWHLDFKSGYRWDPRIRHQSLAYGELPGVDIKVPWELARMQHLPSLALAHQLAEAGDAGFESPETYHREFRNQVLDFIATNPPNFGVNWKCAMDIGIRVANWLVAYDLFRSQGVRFDAEFEEIFIRSIYDHALHISRNLEWSPTLRSNHYLADLAGLLFASAYLPASQETDAWLALSIQELVYEMENQFHPDGSNFEASTSYHRLSGEIMVYATAIILALPDSRMERLKTYSSGFRILGPKLNPPPLPFYKVPGASRMVPLPPWHLDRLAKVGEFARAVRKPSGQAVQIGDNDSGRFLKLTPGFETGHLEEFREGFEHMTRLGEYPERDYYLMENHLDHGHLISAIDGLFRKEPEEIQHSLDREIVSRLTRSSFTSPPTTGTAISLSARVGRESDWEETCQTLNHSLGFTRNRYEIPAPGARLRSGLVLHAFPNFGLYIFRSEKLFLSIRCGPVGQGGNGGHAHNDQLAVELTIEGVDLIRDPGSYLYTPLPAKRNAYRSTRAHFVPRLDGAEPNSLDDGLFSMPDHAHPQCLYFGESGFIGKHDGFGCPVYRLVKIRDDGVTIDDFLEGARSLVRLNPEGFPQDLPFSPGYGLQLRLAGEPAVGFPHKGR